MKAEPPHKVVTDSLPQGLNKGLINSAHGHRKLATVPRTLEPWVDPATAISMANEARKCARGEASAIIPSGLARPFPSPATKELSGLYIESWDRECLSSNNQGYGQ